MFIQHPKQILTELGFVHNLPFLATVMPVGMGRVPAQGFCHVTCRLCQCPTPSALSDLHMEVRADRLASPATSNFLILISLKEVWGKKKKKKNFVFLKKKMAID